MIFTTKINVFFQKSIRYHALKQVRQNEKIFYYLITILKKVLKNLFVIVNEKKYSRCDY